MKAKIIDLIKKLKGAFLNGDGSGVKKRFADHFLVVCLEELDNPLADAFVGGIFELNIELDIALDVEALIPPPLPANPPFRLAS